jgi:hypothetical protein
MYVLYPHLPFILCLGLFWELLIKGIYKIRVPLFGHRFQGHFFYHLPNIKSTWNKFNWIILDNWNYGNFHGGGDFSHAYFIMHKYFGKNYKCKKWIYKLLYTT